MTCADWRTASAEALDRFYEAERTVWEQQLEWDTRDSWREVEAARRAGRLPGVVLTGEGGHVRGFGYCLVDGGLAQLGPLVTDGPDGTPVLAGAVLDVARRAGASRASYFGLDTGPALGQALAAAGFEARPYVYLARPLAPGSPGDDGGFSAWTSGDQAPAARLLQASYGREGRFFAADGRLEQWHRYVGNLVAFAGCGRFEARATRVARAADSLAGLALVTTIRPGVAHLAQLAVHPDARRSGLGARLLDQAMASAAAAGCRTMTLLVEADSPATRLYTSRGFSRRAGFLAAWLARLAPGGQ